MRKSGAYGTGRVFRPTWKRDGQLKESKRYWIAYFRDGVEVREPTGTMIYKDALQQLKDRLAGKLPDQPKPTAERFTIESLIKLIEQEYKDQKHSSVVTLRRSRFPHLRAYFGDRDLSRLTKKDVDAYRRHRIQQTITTGKHKGQTYAGATVNREVYQLHHGLRLAAQEYDLDVQVPAIKTFAEAGPRQGFLEYADFLRILEHVDPWWHDLYRVAYTTGWRVDSEICTLRWSQVDFVHKLLRLEPGTTKNGDGREFGFTPELAAALKRQRARVTQLGKEQGKEYSYVFPRRSGARLLSAYRPFQAATRAAGIHRLVHDFRRTAVRNLVKAGVDRKTAMKMVGHRTEEMFERYHIVDSSQLQEGAKKLAALEAQVIAATKAEAQASQQA